MYDIFPWGKSGAAQYQGLLVLCLQMHLTISLGLCLRSEVGKRGATELASPLPPLLSSGSSLPCVSWTRSGVSLPCWGGSEQGQAVWIFPFFLLQLYQQQQAWYRG